MSQDPPRSRAMELARLPRTEKISLIRALWAQLGTRVQNKIEPLNSLNDDQLVKRILELEEQQ